MRALCKVNFTLPSACGRMKELREAAGITQEQLGQMVGASRQAIHALETEKNEPSIWLAHDIASAFGQPIENVFLFEESERKSRADISRGVKNGIAQNLDL